MANYSDVELREKFNQAVDEAEQAADRVTDEVNRTLHQTFITPLDREHIHALIDTMDDVADLIQDSADTMFLYDVRVMTPEVIELTGLNMRCCELVRDVVKLLDRVSDSKTAEAALKLCNEIDKVESDADRVLRSAMSKLFREEQDMRELLKLKVLYKLMESVTDKCEDVAKVVEGIVLENA